jgi:hypothetical protein
MATTVNFRYALITGVADLDTVLAPIKALTVGHVIYQQECHSTDFSQYAAYIFMVSTPANDLTIVNTLLPQIAQGSGVPIPSFSISGTM